MLAHYGQGTKNEHGTHMTKVLMFNAPAIIMKAVLHLLVTLLPQQTNANDTAKTSTPASRPVVPLAACGSVFFHGIGSLGDAEFFPTPHIVRKAYCDPSRAIPFPCPMTTGYVLMGTSGNPSPLRRRLLRVVHCARPALNRLSEGHTMLAIWSRYQQARVCITWSDQAPGLSCTAGPHLSAGCWGSRL